MAVSGADRRGFIGEEHAMPYVSAALDRADRRG
jgi:hypothetical protein